MNNYLFSIIVPCHNEAEALPKVLKGIDFTTFEVIVVDNASTDTTSQVAENLGAKVIGGIDYRIPTHTHKREIPAYLLLRSLKANLTFDRYFVRGIVHALIYDVFRYDRDVSQLRADELYEKIINSIETDKLTLIDPSQIKI